MKPLLLVAVLAFGGLATAQARVNIHVNIGSGPYYGYSPYDVAYVERYVPAPYVPRVLIMSRYAGIAPHRVVRHYRDGWGWDRMCNHYRVPTRVIYAPAYGSSYVNHPPGKARGHWKHNRGHWKPNRGHGNGYRR